MGGTGPRVNVATLLARVRLQRNRNDDAEDITRTCERLAAPDQADAQIKWRSIRAIAIARRGEHDEAEQLAREAVNLAGKTDQLDSRAEAHVDLAEVLLLSGRGRESGARAGAGHRPVPGEGQRGRRAQRQAAAVPHPQLTAA